MLILDPFANECSIKDVIKDKYKDITYLSNDLDAQYSTDYHLDAIDFLKNFEDSSVDLVLYDPPYNLSQVKQLYTQLGLTVTATEARADYWTRFKREIARVVKPSGKVISFAWHSNGIGMNLGFTQEEILLVAHGGAHYDTICTVEIKNNA